MRESRIELRTMKDRILSKAELPRFLDKLLESGRVIAPVDQGDYSLYRPLEKGEQVCLGYTRPARSAKEVFFPQNETLFYFLERTQKGLEHPETNERTVVFGVPACDLRGIEAQDRLFESGAFQDSYYMKHRRSALLIGLGCLEPGASCFCHYFDIDPLACPSADLFFVPVGKSFYISVHTAEGERLVGELPAATDDQRAALEQLRARPAEFSTEKVPLDSVVRALKERFEDPLWEAVAAKCIGCAACTFVCPTCHCFDITDETLRGVGRRVRTWDSCAFPKFTLHASGHNPRTATPQRMRQRILHKFSYYEDNQGMISCTGCGRCIEVCPVNLDIREILAELATATAK